MTWHPVTKVDNLRDGEILGFAIGNENIALYRIDGQYYATSNICTHAMALLSDGFLDGDCVECPIHQALFHVPTGEARTPPASEPLQTYPTKVEGDDVLVEIDAPS
jgi:3-phenylpropionate/trans-cinnamate dioxygenase ferredoxin subunit